MNVPTILGRSVERLPDKVAVVSDTDRLTFHDVLHRAHGIVVWLMGRSLEVGDRVAVLSRNTHELFELQLACQLGGFAYVPLNFRLSPDELDTILVDCDPKVLFVGSRELELAAALSHDSLQIGLERCATAGAVLPYPAPSAVTTDVDPLPEVDAEAVATIIYTSGTTGPPKGVVITNGMLYARLLVNEHAVGIDEEAIAIHPMPFFHVGAHLAFAFTHRGATNVVPSEFDPLDLAARVTTGDVTHAQLVPTMIERLCHQSMKTGGGAGRPTSLRTIIYGGAPMPAERIEHAMDLLGCAFVQMYGSTETGGVSALRARDHAAELRRVTVGRPNILTQVRVVDPAGRELEIGTEGVLHVRGPSVLTRYWHEEERVDPWFGTGDVAVLDADGYLHLTGRVSDMIISGGENVSPAEVEAQLRTCTGVDDVCVIGIPDRDLGEIVAALVVFNDRAELVAEDLRVEASTRLARYKIPRTVVAVTELPRNLTGKVDRREARTIAMSKQSTPPGEI